MDLFDFADPTKARWREFHDENPHVWDMFERFTFDAIAAGKRNSSAWLIINRIRWETEIVTRGSAFKISNDHIAHYARHFHEQHPEFAGFFRTRPLKSERRAA